MGACQGCYRRRSSSIARIESRFSSSRCGDTVTIPAGAALVDQDRQGHDLTSGSLHPSAASKLQSGLIGFDAPIYGSKLSKDAQKMISALSGLW
ncbi:hypothetical protein HOE425_330702 [Hoeflea sp. EC-HK425]|nr:hypothetical protein HOE425_330702 [Hoeflea sp. EC-HK425]